MSALKQIILSIVILGLAAGGWYAFEHRGEVAAAIGLASPPADQGPQANAPAGQGAQGAGRGPGGGPPGGGRGGGRFGGQVAVVSAPVETEMVGDELRAIGTAAAARAVILYPQVTGVVAEIAYRAGQHVEAGTPLIRLESEEQAIAVDKAKLALTDAQEALDRSERLAKSQSITQVALADARSAVEKAKIDLRSAELALARRTVAAPFAGEVGLVNQSVGDLVNTNTALTTLDDLSALTVTFRAPERHASRLKMGQTVVAKAEGLPGRSFAGTVSAIDSRVDPETRSFAVEVTLEEGIEGLKPGMAVKIEQDFPGEPRATVPSLAIQWDRNGSYVWKLDGDAVHRTGVEILSRRSGAVRVEGLEAGDQVVVEGVQRLREGMTVARLNAPAGAGRQGGEVGGAPRPEGGPAGEGAARGGRAGPGGPRQQAGANGGNG